jgi:hypothetical protein
MIFEGKVSHTFVSYSSFEPGKASLTRRQVLQQLISVRLLSFRDVMRVVDCNDMYRITEYSSHGHDDPVAMRCLPSPAAESMREQHVFVIRVDTFDILPQSHPCR